MEIGVCTSIENAAELPRVIDFFEANIQSFLVPENDDDVFAPKLEASLRAGKPVVAANTFLPATLRCIEPGVDHARLLQYADTAFRRARQTGIETMVFGSGGARRILEGGDKRDATAQFIEVLKLIGPIAERHGIVIVVEPLNRTETNFINSLAEGAEVVLAANHPHVWLLADIYHMLMEDEPASEIVRHGRLLRHAHIAEREGRKAPGKNGEDFRPYLRALKEAGYNRRLAIECNWDDIKTDLAPSVVYLRGQLAEAGF